MPFKDLHKIIQEFDPIGLEEMDSGTKLMNRVDTKFILTIDQLVGILPQLKEEYRILLNELKKHNPELLDKQRFLAISKSDMLDDELQEEITKELPEGIPYIFFSALAQIGLVELKDEIWKLLN